MGFEDFLHAIKNNKIKEIDRLIERGYDPNAIFEQNGLSPLHLAAWYDRPQVINLLRIRGAKVDKEEKNTKKTALHIAAYYGYLDSCEALMHENSSIKSEDKALFMPLHYAALRGHLKVVKLLSDNIKDLWKSSICGAPIDVAIRHKNIEIIDYFLTKLEKHFFPLFSNSGGFSLSTLWGKTFFHLMSGDPFYFATMIGAKDIIRLLLTKKYFRYALARREHTPLHLAAEKGYTEIVKLLLSDPEYTVDEEMYFYSPLELAMRNDHLSTVAVFIERGAKPWLIDKAQLFTERPSSTIEAAIWDGNYSKLKEILEHEGKKVLFEKKSKDPHLQLAILYRQPEIAKLFIEYGGKELILQKNDGQMTALHRAAFHGDFDLFQFILNITGPELLKQLCEVFGTPLDCALYGNHIEIVEWTINQPQLNLSFEELFYTQRDNWVLMDLNPLIGGYFTEMQKLLASNLATSH